MNRSYTCAFGHEVGVHNTCFKRQIRAWNNDLSEAACLVPGCGAHLTEFGKDASCYKGNRRHGILTAMFKTVGRPSRGFGRLFYAGRHPEECAIQ